MQQPTLESSCPLLPLWQPCALEHSCVASNDSRQVQTHLPQDCLPCELTRALRAGREISQEKKKSCYFAWKSLLQRAEPCWKVAMTPALQALPSWGRGMPRCSELAAPRFMWKHSKLLSFWQLSNCSSTRYCFTLHCFPCQEALLYYSTVV